MFLGVGQPDLSLPYKACFPRSYSSMLWISSVPEVDLYAWYRRVLSESSRLFISRVLPWANLWPPAVTPGHSPVHSLTVAMSLWTNGQVLYACGVLPRPSSPRDLLLDCVLNSRARHREMETLAGIWATSGRAAGVFSLRRPYWFCIYKSLPS